MNQLVTHNLAKKYRARWVVRGISLDIKPGEIVGILGPNGAGKTTLFYMIVGLVRPDAGQITIEQQDITKSPIHIRARMGVGYLPQESSIFKKLTVYDNIMAILETQQDLTPEERETKAESLLDEFNISHIRKSLGMSLSGGERRRTEIARALATSPRYILLDEPFAGVDPISVIEIKRMIEQLKQKGLGVLITDHNVRETLDICERAYIINAGEKLAEGTPSEILANDTVKQVYLGDKFKL